MILYKLFKKKYVFFYFMYFPSVFLIYHNFIPKKFLYEKAIECIWEYMVYFASFFCVCFPIISQGHFFQMYFSFCFLCEAEIFRGKISNNHTEMANGFLYSFLYSRFLMDYFMCFKKLFSKSYFFEFLDLVV